LSPSGKAVKAGTNQERILGMGVTEWAIAAIIGYLLGAIPFGLIVTRMGGAGDLRGIGSGNIGATNVLRTGRKSLAALTLLLDLLKGTLAVLLVRHVLPGQEIIAAAAAFFGHLYPIWLGFRGGKGVATYAGILFGLSWPIGMAYAIAWIGMLLAKRISSLGGLSAAVVAPIAAWGVYHYDLVPLLLVCSAIVFWKHWENMQRLTAGTEPVIGQK
jgi:acyl phosphate:glycerol-3-phosphate acyltransferase